MSKILSIVNFEKVYYCANMAIFCKFDLKIRQFFVTKNVIYSIDTWGKLYKGENYMSVSKLNSTFANVNFVNSSPTVSRVDNKSSALFNFSPEETDPEKPTICKGTKMAQVIYEELQKDDPDLDKIKNLMCKESLFTDKWGISTADATAGMNIIQMMKDYQKLYGRNFAKDFFDKLGHSDKQKFGNYICKSLISLVKYPDINLNQDIVRNFEKISDVINEELDSFIIDEDLVAEKINEMYPILNKLITEKGYADNLEKQNVFRIDNRALHVWVTNRYNHYEQY